MEESVKREGGRQKSPSPLKSLTCATEWRAKKRTFLEGRGNEKGNSFGLRVRDAGNPKLIKEKMKRNREGGKGELF